MTAQTRAIMLAGTLLPTPFAEATGMPSLCLPMGCAGALLHRWLRVLSETPDLSEVVIVVNSQREVEQVEKIAREGARNGVELPAVRAIPEPARWRGVAGILRDMLGGSGDVTSLVCEANALPPATLTPIFEALGASVVGVVGTVAEQRPAGVYAFRPQAVELAPRIGYYDLKEQLLPALHARGMRVVTAAVGAEISRISMRRNYLQAVQRTLAQDDAIQRIAQSAFVSGSAILDGFCIIEPNVVIEDGAIVRDSILLGGATVGGGAVVSESVIGPLGRVEPRDRAIREVVSGGGASISERSRSSQAAPTALAGGARR